MPTYDYFCTKCEQTFEIVQSMKDPHLDTCPESRCRLETWGHGCVKRQMGTGAGLIFKGSGFYITDYRSDNYKEGAKKDAPAPAPAASGAEAAKPKTDAPAPAAPKPEPAKTSPPPPKAGPA